MQLSGNIPKCLYVRSLFYENAFVIIEIHSTGSTGLGQAVSLSAYGSRANWALCSVRQEIKKV